MQLIRDYYLIYIDQLFESSTTKSGIITSNTAVVNEETEERSAHKRRYGIVLEVPAGFSDESVMFIDPGLPAPKAYISHEYIQSKRNAGHRAGKRNYDEKMYQPCMFNHYESITCADIGKMVDIKAGERVYFTENATERERFMGRHNDGFMYAVRVDEIQAAVRESPIFEGYSSFKKKRIIMQGGWVLVKVNMETWQDITTPSGVIMKVAPEAIPLQGTIVEVSHRPDLKPGDKILFECEADAPCTVEGQEYVIMRDEDVLVKLN